MRRRSIAVNPRITPALVGLATLPLGMGLGAALKGAMTVVPHAATVPSGPCPVLAAPSSAPRGSNEAFASDASSVDGSTAGDAAPAPEGYGPPLCRLALASTPRKGEEVSDEDLLRTLVPGLDSATGFVRGRQVKGEDPHYEVRDCLGRWRGGFDSVDARPDILARRPLRDGVSGAWVALGHKRGYCTGPIGVLVVFDVNGPELRILGVAPDDLGCRLETLLEPVPFPGGRGLITQSSGDKDGHGGFTSDTVWSLDSAGLRRLGEIPRDGDTLPLGVDGADPHSWTHYRANIDYSDESVAVARITKTGGLRRTSQELDTYVAVDGGLRKRR